MARDASGAEDALGILRDEVFDVLLTDVGPPGKSGIELAREALNAFPSLCVIFSSGSRTKFDSKRLPHTGAVTASYVASTAV
jgi:YesN/AraC family two-component response regulator